MSHSELFDAAVGLPPDERAAFLDQTCGADGDRRREVESLLRRHEAPDSFLREPVGRTAAYEPVAEGPGAVVGPYKLLEQIGEGGFGVVFLAEQERPVRRKVALKVLKPGMDTRQVVARFEAERQALAIMDHPNIAKVFDAGVTPSARPYFVMELVRGVPITDFCDRHHLPPRARLELFVSVCHAVQHAHQKGIIHRDLKPSNVLVTRHDPTPVVKVIDFGVAKALGQELTDKTLLTGVAQMIGTPLYMSPEQAGVGGLDIDTRSDVFSLGVLLYELLTGTTPFTKERFKQAGYDEIWRIIREEEPPTPSTRLIESKDSLPSVAACRQTEPARLTRLVRGELDWIVMKAIEKDRVRRYETASGFAADVQRYLAGEPVLAAPASPWYRLRKFVRRNRSGLAAAALVLSCLVLLGGGLGWAARDRSAREAEAARQRGQRQAKVAGEVESIFADVDRLEGEQKWHEALEAVRRAAAAVAGGEADPATAERVHQKLRDLEFIDRLEQIRMVNAAWVEGKFDDAGADREYARAFRDYGVDVQELAEEMSIDRFKGRSSLAIPLASALDHWVYARLNIGVQDSAGLRRLVAVARGIDPDPLRNRLRSTWGQPISAELRDELRRVARSIDIRAQSPATLVFLASTLQRAEDSDTAVRILRDAQNVYRGDYWLNFDLGSTLSAQKDFEGAIRYYTAAAAIRPTSTAALYNLGNALFSRKKLDEAVTEYRKAIEIDPKHIRAHNNLGNVLRDQKKLDEAIAEYRKAIDLDSKYAHAHANLGLALYHQKKLDEAVAEYRKAVELDPDHVNAHNNLGNALRDQKKLDEAVAEYRKAIELAPKYAHAHANLGLALHDQKKPGEAIAAYRKAIELDPEHVNAHIHLGNAHRDQKKLDEAVAAYRKAVEFDPKHAIAHNNLGNALRDQKKLDEAVAAYRKAVELDPDHARAHYNLGLALRDQKKLDEAVAEFRKVIELEPKHVNTHINLGLALRDQKKLDEAIAEFRKAIELDPDHVGARFNLGNALYHQKKLDEAVAAYRKAVELAPKYADTHNNLGNALYDQRKLGEAVAAYRKAVELDPKHAIAHNNLGNALRDQKKLDEAIAAYRMAIELRPRNAGTHYHLGNALREMKDLDGAERAYREAVHLDGDRYGAAMDALSQLLLARGKVKEAVATAKKAVDLAPRSALATKVLGLAEYRAGNWTACIEALEKSCALQDDPKGGDSWQWFLLAMANRQLGREQKAREWYDRAVVWMDKNQPKNEELRRFRADAAELLELAEKK